MEIKLKNYKNIGELAINFIDNKVNFVYGMSGAGKSSIFEAIVDKTPSENVKFGMSADSVSISPRLESEQINIFNGGTPTLLLDEEGSNAVYRILFNNSGEIDKIYDKLNDYFMKLNECRPQMNTFLENMAKLKKEIGITRGSSFPKNGKDKLSLLEKESEDKKYKENYNFLKRNGTGYLEWVIAGADFPVYKIGKCPFCSRKLSENKKKYLEKVISLKPKNYEALSSSITFNEVFKLDVPNYTSKRSIKSVKNKVEELFSVEQEVKGLLEIFDNLNTSNLDITKLTKFSISEMLKNQLPELANAIEIYNASLDNIQHAAKRMNGETRHLIKKNLDKLNYCLKILGIPYYFLIGKYEKNAKIASTYLVHNDNKTENNNVKNLSYGEKNIVSLLLFIFSVDKEIVVIDDPASSFDENRRTIIYRLIMDNIRDKSVIILSHDQSFVRNAIIDIKNEIKRQKKSNGKEKFYEKWQDAASAINIGELLYLSQYNGKVHLRNIDIDDFNNLSIHAKKFMQDNNLSYFRKIINLRIYIESLGKDLNETNKLIYGYLSLIMHHKYYPTRQAVISNLEKQHKNEKEILNLIKKEFSIELEPLPENRLYDFKEEELTPFEKVVYKRETMNKNCLKYKELNKYARDTLSDIVHLNNQTVYTLNPYKYVSYPQNVLDIISEE